VAGLRTEFPFTLPKGFVDASGTLHRHGTMRLATARDEIEPLRDRNVTGPDDPYLTILVLARVINELGSLDQVAPIDVENFFAADLAFLQDLYGIINFGDPADVEALQSSVLPVDSSGEPGGDTASDAELVDAELVIEETDGGGADGDGAGSSRAASARRRGHIEEVRRTGSS
jgi:hypothetical protein